MPLVTGVSNLGLTQTWRVGPADRDHADPAYVSFDGLAGPKALMPYAPVRVRAQRTSDGVTFSFLRRGRRDSDGWEVLDIPLGEDVEAYECALLAGGAVVRTLTAGTPTLFYLAEDLRRYLERRPIHARRTSPLEKFRLWCRRNPWLAASNIAAGFCEFSADTAARH